MHVDLGTLYAVTTFATAVSGLMLLFSWLQDRRATTLAWWGGGMLVLVAGGALLALRGIIPDSMSIIVGNCLWLGAYGAMWCGARTFEGRRPSLLGAVAAPVLWIALCHVDAFWADAPLRVRVFSVINCGLALAIAWEYWRARDPELVSRWPAIVLLLVHAGFFLLRIPFAGSITFPLRPDNELGLLIPAGIAALLLHYFCMAFLVMAMVKERLELRHRREALIDPLTGAANRRAFFERGERLLGRLAGDGETVALLMFDLDFFKQINDTLGHEAGDRVLCEFCRAVAGVLRPGDLFGRTGGEEFACVLPGATAPGAAVVAERIRATVVHLGPVLGVDRLSVSVGVAATATAGWDLAALMAAADRALYRAKANGRNRVEQASIVADAPPLGRATADAPPPAPAASTGTPSESPARTTDTDRTLLPTG